MSEIVIICLVALLVFGPEQLPDIVKKVAKGMKEVRKASDDFKRSINLDDDDDRPRWRPPAPPAPTLEASSTEPPAAIPGSALAGEHPASPKLVIKAVDAVSVDADLGAAEAAAVDAHRDAESTDPQKPSSLSSQTSAPSPSPSMMSAHKEP